MNNQAERAVRRDLSQKYFDGDAGMIGDGASPETSDQSRQASVTYYLDRSIQRIDLMPTIGVSVAILYENKILLTKRKDVGFWCIPGGSVEDGETVSQSALREVKEETGLDVELKRLVGIYSRPNWWDGGAHEILLSGVPEGGQLKRKTAETLDAGYFGLEELPNEILFWHHRRIHDAFVDRPAILRLQDVVWPFGPATREEAYDLIVHYQIDPDEMTKFLIGKLLPARERLEVGLDITIA
jgi:ADP-ribose pyrophosphatase YjhB (NUDIX family)